MELNGWADRFIVEALSPDQSPAHWNQAGKTVVQIRLRDASGTVVGVYCEGETQYEQIQSECFRFLRTGRTGP